MKRDKQKPNNKKLKKQGTKELKHQFLIWNHNHFLAISVSKPFRGPTEKKNTVGEGVDVDDEQVDMVTMSSQNPLFLVFFMKYHPYFNATSACQQECWWVCSWYSVIWVKVQRISSFYDSFVFWHSCIVYESAEAFHAHTFY